MSDEQATPGAPRQQPPSFTPQGTPARPSSDAGAVPVGGSHAPVAHVPSRPAARRPAPAREGTPPSLPPRASAARPAAPDARPARISSAPRTSASPQGQATGGAARPTTRPARSGTRPAARPAAGGTGGPGGPGGAVPPTGAGAPAAGAAPSRARRWLRPRRIVALVLALLLVVVIAWPVGLLLWADSKIQHTDALSGAAATAGTTYLLAGSDSRDGAISNDGTEGSRTDTIMVLHVPDDGPAALISLPRDTFVDIAGHGPAKLNAAYAYGGAPLLVSTVESLTGLTVDHYVEIGLAGVRGLVTAVGGVNLCLDYDVNDEKSGLKWKAGCHTVGGKRALAFIRMRYSDPKGDLGRAERQRQLVSALTAKAATPSTLFNPGLQVDLIEAGLGAVTADESMSILDLGRMAMAFRKATGDEGITGTPRVANPDYRPGGVGSTVLLDPDTTPTFFSDIAAGTLAPGTYDATGKVTTD